MVTFSFAKNVFCYLHVFTNTFHCKKIGFFDLKKDNRDLKYGQG